MTWDTTLQPGDAARWTPNARGRARGLEPVEGRYRGGGQPNATRFARLDPGTGKVVQVWENQGSLTRVEAAPEAVPPVRPAPVRAPPARPARRAVAARPPVDDAGLARPPRATPAEGVRLPEGVLKTLHSAETVLPRLGDAPVFAPARAVIAALRAWVEGRGEAPGPLADAAFEAMDAAADDPTAYEVVLVARAIGQHRWESAHEIARELAEACRADALGFSYAEELARVTANPAYAIDDNPTLTPPSPPAPEIARAWTVARAAEVEDGYTMTSDVANAAYVRSKTAETWRDVNRGLGPMLRRRLHRVLLNAKEGLLAVFAVAKRSGYTKRPDALWNRWFDAREALTRLAEVQAFEVAWASGLRNPAREAAEILRAKLAADAAPHVTTLVQRGPRVDALLHALAADLTALVASGVGAFERARAADRTMRVAQTADVADLLRDKLQTEIADLARGGRWLFRFATVITFVEGEWVNAARPRPDGGTEALVPYSDAAYQRPTREAVRAFVTGPLAARALITVQAIGAADAEALVVAEETVAALRESEGVQGPWWAAHHPPVSTLPERWAEYATGRRGLHPMLMR